MTKCQQNKGQFVASCDAVTTLCMLPEMEVLEGEVGFNDTGGLHSGSQDVLLCGLVVPCPNAV